MRMFWNGGWAAGTREKGDTALAHVLKAATIVIVAWSCILPASGQEEEEEPAPPPIESITVEEDFAPIRQFLSNQGVEAKSVRIVTIAYTNDKDEEQLIAFKLAGSAVADPRRREEEFLIPDFGSTFVSAECTVVGNSTHITSCGARYRPAGGTIYYRNCSFGTSP